MLRLILAGKKVGFQGCHEAFTRPGNEISRAGAAVGQLWSKKAKGVQETDKLRPNIEEKERREDVANV